MTPKVINVNALSAIVAKIASWILIRLVSSMSRPLVEVIGNCQRVARGVRAGYLADGAALLKFQLAQNALEERPGQKAVVDSAQSQVDHRGEVRGVASQPFGQRRPWEREGKEKVQRAGERRPRIGQRLQDRTKVLEFLGQVGLDLVDRVGEQRAELAQLAKRV